MQSIKLLLLEDSERDATLLVRKLQQADFKAETTRVDTPEALREALASGSWDLIICDYELPTIDAPQAVSIIRATGLDIPIIVVSGKVGEESAVAVMRAGAQDYLTKDRLFRLGEVVRRELAEVAIRRERAEVKSAFLASEDRLRFALEAARMGVWDWDVVTDAMHWEPGAPQFWGDEGGGWRGDLAAWMAVVHREDRELVSRAIDEVVTGQHAAYAVEHRVVLADKRIAWIDVRGRVFFDGTGKAIRMAGTFLDITQRRAMEGRLAQGEKMRTIGHLAGGVAHDFNNLLTVILTYNQLMETMYADDPAVTDLTAPVRDAAERAAALTRQLLVFSRPEAVAPRVLDLNDVIKGVTKLLVRLLGEQVAFETQLADDVWRVRMDASQCEQVILNLAVNARDAMPGGGRLLVSTRNVSAGAAELGRHGVGAASGDQVVLEVVDAGHGMTEEVRAKVFEPFFTTKAQGRGTGLGLATCHAVVSNAGGHIHLDSTVGVGTTFRVYLPRTHGDADRVALVDRTVRPGSLAERILVVEDDELVRSTAERALRMAGYTVVGAADGEEALRILQQGSTFAVLLTDLVMPRLGGIELADIVHIRAPRTKILFTSGYPVDAPTQQVLARSAPLLAKPYTAVDLTRRIRELLDS